MTSSDHYIALNIIVLAFLRPHAQWIMPPRSYVVILFPHHPLGFLRHRRFLGVSSIRA
jgi:hypothetical protein